MGRKQTLVTRLNDLAVGLPTLLVAGLVLAQWGHVELVKLAVFLSAGAVIMGHYAFGYGCRRRRPKRRGRSGWR